MKQPPQRVHHAAEPGEIVRAIWKRATFVIGFAILLGGYALLAVSPDTPSEWVLVRVASGFGMLFVGFFLAVLPWLTRLFGGDED